MVFLHLTCLKYNFFHFSANKQQVASSQVNDLCHNTVVSGESIFPSTDNSHYLKTTSACAEDTEVDLKSISCFSSFGAETLHLACLENNGSHSQSARYLKVQDAFVKGSSLTGKA